MLISKLKLKNTRSSHVDTGHGYCCCIVEYLLDSLSSILVMNDGIYEVQAPSIVLQDNNNIHCSPFSPGAADENFDFLFPPASLSPFSLYIFY